MISLFNVLCLYVVVSLTASDNVVSIDTGSTGQAKCLLPLPPEHGSYTHHPASTGIRIDDFRVNITCDPGYKLTGPETLGCWNSSSSQTMPECRPFCMLRGTKPIFINQCVFPSGQVFNYDFDFSNDALETSDSEQGTNESVLCTVPAFPRYGAFAISPPLSTGDNTTSFRLTAFCETGYELVGSSTIQCKAGRLTHPMPTCLPPCVPVGGKSAETLICEDVLKTADINKIPLTSANGIKEFKIPPTLGSKTSSCVLPVPPLYGSYASSPVGSPGDRVESFLLQVVCSRGYKLAGEGTVNCSHGVWMQPMPKCRRFCSSSAGEPIKANKCVLPSGQVFRINGNYSKGDGEIMGEIISAEEATKPPPNTSRSCFVPSFPEHGVFNNQTVEYPNSTMKNFLTIVCDGGYELVGRSYVICKPERLEHPIPLCFPTCAAVRNDILQCGDTISDAETFKFPTTTAAPVQTTTAEIVSSNDGIEKCVMPPFPTNGRYRSYPAEPPGIEVDAFQLNVTCNPGYYLFGEKNIKCIFGLMEEEMPECISYCKIEQQSTISCEGNEYRCALATSDEIPLNSGINSEFTGCGTVGVFRQRRGPVSGGFTPRPYEFPWHTGIYRISTARRYEQICGGTIIARTVVVSAAHCFTESRRVPSAKLYAVAAGKRYRRWNHEGDIHAQESTVKHIKVPQRYQGPLGNFQEDIALVITDSEFEYDRYVKPACISFDSDFDEEQLSAGTLGKIAGWGLTDEESPSSPILQSAKLPSISVEQCIDESPKSFRSSITADKICVGYYNGTSACRGDSGGGFVVPTRDDEPRFYLRGIISTSPVNGKDCNIYTWITLTHILRHEHFIKSVLSHV